MGGNLIRCIGTILLSPPSADVSACDFEAAGSMPPQPEGAYSIRIQCAVQ